jgi:predicted Zn-dependent protease
MNATARLEQLQKLLAAEPNDAFLNFGLAMELAKLQRYSESLAAFDRVLELDPAYIAAHFHKGKTLLAMGQTSDAKNALETGINEAAKYGELHAKSEMEELLGTL